MKPLLKKCAVLTVLILCAQESLAMPEFWETFQKTYQIQPGSRIAVAACKNCHTSPPRRNSFGKAVERVLVRGKLTADGLAKVEQQTSGNGPSYGEMIRSDIVPGGAKDSTGGPTTEEEVSPMVPEHSFHPLVVHFPIALFFFGAIMEVLGVRRNNFEMRAAGFWAFFGACLSLLVVLPTGLIARARLGFPFEGTLLIHFIGAAASALGLIALVIWRRKGIPSNTGYWLFLAILAIIIGITGHFGSELVYGR